MGRYAVGRRLRGCAVTAIQSKADRDRLRQRAGGNARLVAEVRRILREYREGRAASSCMAEIERVTADRRNCAR